LALRRRTASGQSFGDQVCVPDEGKTPRVCMAPVAGFIHDASADFPALTAVMGQIV
jgi:hypothetical protein